eukprot:bmy_16605T0
MVVLSGMEPAFHRGDLLFLTNFREDPVRAGEIIVFKVEGQDIPKVHRVIKVHKKDNGDIKFLTKGGNNEVDNRGLYKEGQNWLEKKDVVGGARGFLPYVDFLSGTVNQSFYDGKYCKMASVFPWSEPAESYHALVMYTFGHDSSVRTYPDGKKSYGIYIESSANINIHLYKIILKFMRFREPFCIGNIDDARLSCNIKSPFIKDMHHQIPIFSVFTKQGIAIEAMTDNNNNKKKIKITFLFMETNYLFRMDFIFSNKETLSLRRQSGVLKMEAHI